MQTEDEFLEKHLLALFKAYDEFLLGIDFDCNTNKESFKKRKNKMIKALFKFGIKNGSAEKIVEKLDGVK